MPYSVYLVMVVSFMALILYNLFKALYFLVTGKEDGRGTARYLGRRIALSMAFFLLLIALNIFGLVEDKNLGNMAAEITTEGQQAESDQGKTLEEIQQQPSLDGGRIRLKP